MTLTGRHRWRASLVMLAVLLATVLPAAVISAAAPAAAAPARAAAGFELIHGGRGLATRDFSAHL